MLCDECKVNPATIHIATIIGGVQKGENLCQQCWQKRNAQLLGGLKVGDLLSKLLGAQHKDEENQEEAREQVDITCGSCGMTYAEFQKSGHVGCAHCYAAFGEYMESTLKSLHGHARHVGKAPAYLAGEWQAQRELDELRAKMNEAVAAEDFEQAAALRDRIRGLTLANVAREMKEAETDG